MSQYFLKPINVLFKIQKLNSIHLIMQKSGLKGVTGADTFDLAAKSDSANLKAVVDKMM